MEAQGIALQEGGRSPYGPDLGIWYPVNCTFDGPVVRERLQIPESVTYEEYDGRVAGSDATWFCKQCGRAIMGMIPRYAPSGTPRVK